MSFGAFLKRCLMEYFIITTCVTAATAILGQALDPAARFGYDAYFSPLIFGLVSLIPSLLTYSRKELSLRRTLVRKATHVIVLEATLIVFGLWAGILHGISDVSSFGLTVFIVYLAVNLIGWQIGKKDAVEINEMLKSLQDRDDDRMLL